MPQGSSVVAEHLQPLLQVPPAPSGRTKGSLGDLVLPTSLFQTNTGIQKNLEQEVINYNFKTSFFDIFVSGLGDPASREGAGTGVFGWISFFLQHAS